MFGQDMNTVNILRHKIVPIVLGLLEVSAILAVAAVAPNTLQLLRFVGGNKKRSKRVYYINQVVERLARKKLIEFRLNSQGFKCARLTAKGRAELDRYRLSELKIKKPRRWDGRYRLVIFDIKEWKRSVRDRMRRWLEHLGFIRLQNSVWVHPYECQEVVSLLKSHFHIGREILYLRAESIENDYWLKKEFGLT